MQEILNKITKTQQGYKVKNLRFKPVDNIITGQVLDPVTGRKELYEGYIAVTWQKNGVITDKFRERNGDRYDLNLTIPI